MLANTMEINLIAPINSLGYGNVGLNISKALLAERVRLNLFPIGQVEASKSDCEAIRPALEAATTANRKKPTIKLWHQFDLKVWPECERKIGFPIFELDRLAANEQEQVKNCDLVCGCSEWAAAILKKYTQSVSVVPLGVDHNMFSPTTTKVESKRPTVFLNSGKWEKRKGHDVLPTIFERAFTTTDNVELWVLSTNPFLTSSEVADWIRPYRLSPLSSKIRILPRLPFNSDVATLMRAADFGIFPTRAEGWNLEALEMVACGKPIVSTNYSGHTQFLNTSNSILVDFDEMELANDGRWFFSTGMWGKHNDKTIDGMATAMRNLYEGKITLNNVHKTVTDFTWKNTARKLIECCYP